MHSFALRSIAGAIAAACIIVPAARLVAIETTYGEDPVPNTGRFPGSINLGYGVDPIPAKSLAERWHAWRASRGLEPDVRTYQRTRAPSTPPLMGGPGEGRTSFRRTAPSSQR